MQTGATRVEQADSSNRFRQVHSIESYKYGDEREKNRQTTHTDKHQTTDSIADSDSTEDSDIRSRRTQCADSIRYRVRQIQIQIQTGATRAEQADSQQQIQTGA
ncbi:hypothetical protein Tco_1500939 [Tanacetum coccineum]